ncbi:hypothetical protein MN116_005295 [Schistosoma mekongi]|uniref:Probable cytosolic iron-sulfur protein assembly protein CIAO1 homolog n=1 Tax=Schistosoma mekongi TaxID=38744 RepID=A0AAE2D5H3_SCHME|nr:hypothetical protein MN116_005295 [Schistosoma mekongi]
MLNVREVQKLKASNKRLWSLGWNHKGSVLISSGEDRVIKLWAKCNDQLWGSSFSLPEAHKRSIRCVTWSPCGNYIASASFDGTVTIWKISEAHSEHEMEALVTLEGHTSEVKCVAWCPSGHLIATCGRDKSVWLWEFDDEEDVQCVSVLQPHSQDVKSVAWHPHDEVLVSTSYDNKINVYREELDDWTVFTQLSGHDSTVWKAEFSPSGDILASCSDDLCVKLWAWEGVCSKSSSWMCIATLTGYHTRTIFDLNWSPDSQLLASCGSDNRLCIYKMPSSGLTHIGGKPCFEEPPVLWGHVPSAHSEDVNCVRWKPGNITDISCSKSISDCHLFLTTASDDGYIKFWSIEYEA